MVIFTGIFGLVIGSLAIWMAFRFIKLYFKVRSWTRVRAKVVSKEVKIHKKYSTSRSPYKVSADYVYSIGSKEYKGSLIYLVELLSGQAGHLKKTAETKLEKIHDEMEVYVDPKDPSRSVMFCEGIGLYVLVLFMGLFAIIFGLSKLM